MDKDRQDRLRSLPSVDEALQALRRQSSNGVPVGIATECIRGVLDRLRREILASGDDAPSVEVSLDRVVQESLQSLRRALTPKIRRVVNATGIVLHTNLGRAPLGRTLLTEVVQAVSGYLNLEYNLETGERGRREAPIEALLQRLVGAEAAGVVNNNATAVLLCLSALAKDREVIVSRGELVEIGGGFRIPEVMRESGATLREVGTTNKTRLSDYAEAINENSALLLKVHTSNYRIVGFTEEVGVAELSALGRERGLPLMVDLGSGSLIDLARLGIHGEPTPKDLISQGAGLVTFSGDKLLGGPQAGIFAGQRDLVERARRHPLMRALRLDKIALAVLERTLLAYLDPDTLPDTLPGIGFLLQSEEDVRVRAERLIDGLSAETRNRLKPIVIRGVSQSGGGTLPDRNIPTALIALGDASATGLRADGIERRMRSMDTPVIGRIQDDAFLLDLRTVLPEEEDWVRSALESLARDPGP